ncbi:hypothetical protein LY90DRAFT_702753 [Neocallimastix californiae]|uniref:Periplasmic binding protein-like II n=1 Tax=Neocallimastix californiae TaxID=1754190 RepID=A0A1Y2CYN5_9FUNG|nr:hypothetical protein LY90DRAFT_702753 [Neocallimastix californiae]|eukprot:ORY52140.1 hypothetical protein LY90DRAFT_702753 [Neocallimastix californiae]
MYNNRYGPYLLDLKEYLPKKHIDLYSKGFVPKISTFNNKLVSLPIKVDYSILYSNTKLLDKYNKPVPETWDELIDTSKYIMEKEKENDSELISFNGLFDDSEIGTCSLFEYIYSFRDSNDSSFPSFNNETVVNAIKYLKDMKMNNFKKTAYLH